MHRDPRFHTKAPIAAWAVLLTLVGGRPGMAESNVQRTEYLADVAAARILFTAQDWGELGLNSAVRAGDTPPAPIRIRDKTYERGLGHHANGEIFVELGGRYETFEVDVGVQWQGGALGSVVFQVFVDDEKRFDSGVMRDRDEARPVRVPVRGARELRLVVTDAGDGVTGDCANWADARLVLAKAATTTQPAAALDAAPFARIVTSDADRKHGTRAKRTEEFPAEDVYLSTELLPRADGAVDVRADAKGRACVGLEWFEARLLRRIELHTADAAAVPAPDRVTVEYWVGESPWQGEWKPFRATPTLEGNALSIAVDGITAPDARGGHTKVRWILPAAGPAVTVRQLRAYTATPLHPVSLRLEPVKPRAGASAPIEMYNGRIATPGSASPALRTTWDLSGPMVVSVQACRTRPWKTDRTLLRIAMPDRAIGIAIDDVLNGDGVFVPAAGVYVTRADGGVSLAEYRQRHADDRTVLDRVRSMPEQTFERAWAAVHNPVQDDGPMMLSLASDNRKFVVERDGTITFDVYDTPDQAVGEPRTYRCRLAARVDSPAVGSSSRHLYGDWLPAPQVDRQAGDVRVRQRTFVAPVEGGPPPSPPWLFDRAVCVAQCVVENAGAKPADVRLTLALTATEKSGLTPEAREVEHGLAIVAADRVLGFLDSHEAAPLTMTQAPDGIVVQGSLAAGVTARVTAWLPAWKTTTADCAALTQGDALGRFEAYWDGVMSGAMQVDVPDAFLASIIRASQVHCWLAARNEEHGRRIAPWIGSDRYGPLESESHAVIRGMDMLGQPEFARRGLAFFIRRYNAAGYLTTGYTTMGTGWHLWTLAEHVERYGDTDWLRPIAPEVTRVCHWVAREADKTRGLDARGEPMPESGLMPPGVAADWNRYAYRYMQQAHFYAALRETARALRLIDHPDAAALAARAEQLRDDVLRAYRWTQERSAVLALADGTSVPAYPGMMYCFGRIGDMIPGEDGHRSWAYDVELGAHHLASLGVLPAESPEVEWMMNHMEDVWFLAPGMGDYPGERSRADWFNLGGFSKLQPYYTRIADIYALRDDVKPFIRSYFNTIPSLLSRETLSFWEHFHNTGAWNKTHETGYFLAQTAMMFADERGDELWLAPFVPSAWMIDGRTVVVRQAPTRFGPVAFTITSSVDDGFIEATVEPPTRSAPRAIVLRLRHPDGRAMRGVEVSGKACQTFDTKRETIRIEPTAGPIHVRATY